MDLANPAIAEFTGKSWARGGGASIGIITFDIFESCLQRATSAFRRLFSVAEAIALVTFTSSLIVAFDAGEEIRSMGFEFDVEIRWAILMKKMLEPKWCIKSRERKRK